MPTDRASTMTPDAVIARLQNNNYHLPEDALAAAVAMPETMTPLLLEHLDKVADNPSEMITEDDWLAFYSLFLLAVFKEGRTLPIVQRMVENTPESLDWILGDSVTEKGSRLFASLAVSNPDMLRPFIENQALDEFIRAEALEAYQCLYYNGIVTIDELRPYLHSLAYDKLRRGKYSPDSCVWFAWVRCCLELGVDDLHPLAKKAFDEKWIDSMVSDWDHEIAMLTEEREQERRRRNLGALITNVADELRGWYCFTEAYRESLNIREEQEKRSAKERSVESRRELVPLGTIVNETPKAKPNQPCPCGSGKKYKKCCGRK